MRKLLLISVILGFVFIFTSPVSADCPDMKIHCTDGHRASYGTCWHWSWFQCKPCSDAWKHACDGHGAVDCIYGPNEMIARVMTEWWVGMCKMQKAIGDPNWKNADCTLIKTCK